MKLGYGDSGGVQFSGSFSGKLSPDFCYTRFSLFTNAGLWPGWTRDQMDNDGTGVEVKIEYDFGGGRTRTELYGPTAKFNLQTNNAGLNHNDLTEYATTTVSVTRNKSENPLTPAVTGVAFASVPEVTHGTVKVTIWSADTSPKGPDIYLSCDCPLATQRASWITLPYRNAYCGATQAFELFRYVRGQGAQRREQSERQARRTVAKPERLDDHMLAGRLTGAGHGTIS